MRLLRFVMGIAATCGVCFIASVSLAATPLTTELVETGLIRPIFVTHAPDDFGRIFIIEKRGLIKVLDISTVGATATTFMNIDPRVTGGTTPNSEQGLLGLAFDPDYNSNGSFYVNYTTGPSNNWSTRVSRFSVNPGNANLGDDTSEQIMLTFSQPQANHNGGWIGFGPNDGMLYIATGDGGGADDSGTGHTLATGNSQDITNNLLGKMLRLDVSGANTVIPPDNPFVNTNGDDEIWAYGLRNPWRNAFDSLTGDLWMADVGQGTWEEVDFQPADSLGGENYGWRCREGAHNFNFQLFCSALTFDEPVHEYIRGGSPFRCAITGGEIYRGCAIPDLRGTYFFADFCADRIWSLTRSSAGAITVTEVTSELDPPGAAAITDITSFGRDAAGEMYICDQGGQVYRIIADGAADPPSPQDWDNDGDVDDFDLEGFVSCETSPDGSFVDCQCDVFDADGNSTIDLRDFQAFQAAFTG